MLLGSNCMNFSFWLSCICLRHWWSLWFDYSTDLRFAYVYTFFFNCCTGAFYILQKQFPGAKFIALDIMCKYSVWLAKIDPGLFASQKRFLSVMHAKAHNWNCQVCLHMSSTVTRISLKVDIISDSRWLVIVFERRISPKACIQAYKINFVHNCCSLLSLIMSWFYLTSLVWKWKHSAIAKYLLHPHCWLQLEQKRYVRCSVHVTNHFRF